MKSKLSIITIVLLFSTLVGSCKKSDSPNSANENITATASFTIDGDNFHKQTISIQGEPKTTTRCVYSLKEKITQLTINDQPDISTEIKNQFFLVFNGNTPATQHAGDDPNGGSFNSLYFDVSVTDKQGVLNHYLFENPDGTPGVFTINKYGEVGETVGGTFSGVLVDEHGAPVITISVGKFSITRGEDIE